MSIKFKDILKEAKKTDFSNNEINYVKRLLKTIGLQRDIGAWWDDRSSKNEIQFQIINGNAIEPATTEDEYVLTKKIAGIGKKTSYSLRGREETFMGYKPVKLKEKKISGNEDLNAIKSLFKQLRNTNL